MVNPALGRYINENMLDFFLIMLQCNDITKRYDMQVSQSGLFIDSIFILIY